MLGYEHHDLGSGVSLAFESRNSHQLQPGSLFYRTQRPTDQPSPLHGITRTSLRTVPKPWSGAHHLLSEEQGERRRHGMQPGWPRSLGSCTCHSSTGSAWLPPGFQLGHRRLRPLHPPEGSSWLDGPQPAGAVGLWSGEHRVSAWPLQTLRSEARGPPPSMHGS